MRKFIDNYISDKYEFDKKTMFGIICLIISIAGVFGFIYEFIFYYFNSGMKYFYMRGGNFLPWINIYAIGALFIYFVTYKYKKNPFIVFFLSLLLCGVIEFIGGYLLYVVGDGFRCWDYNTEILNFGNIYGFVCLRSVTFFGLSGLILMYLIVPLCYYMAIKIDNKVFVSFCTFICFIFIIDELYNLIFARLFLLPRASSIYKKIGFKYMKF